MSYKKLLRDIKLTLSLNSILQHTFSIILLFSLTYLILSILKIDSLLITFVIASAYFLYASIKIREDWNLLYTKYPKLADEIATFKDTINQDSEMIRKLREDTLKKVKKISNSEFIDYKPIFLKSIGIIFITLLILFTPLINIPKVINMPDIDSISAKGISKITEIITNTKTKNEEDNSIPKITERKEQLKITYKMEYDLSDKTDPEKLEFTEDNEKSLQSSMDDIYIEHISKDEENIIKRYFSKQNK